jgi:cytoskeletal protein CcmA (bactofilin family)
MFKKNKRLNTGPAPSIDQITMMNKTIIGEQITIEGNIKGKGDLVIEGSVKGDIEVGLHHLTIGKSGQVKSDIHASNVTISGKLVGIVNAKGKVEITKEADFNGEIKAKSISIEDGAHLKAVIELTREPSDKDTPVSKQDTKTAFDSGKGSLAPTSEISERK